MQLNRAALITTGVFLFIFLFFACTHQVVNPDGGNNNGGDTTGTGNGGGNGGGNGDSLICFEEQILPLFQTSCAKSGCHNGSSHQGDYVLDSYDHIVAKGIVAGNHKNSKLYQVLISNGDEDVMPPPPDKPLSQLQINLIAQWIDEGAQNTTNCSNQCDTSLYTYSGEVRPIIDLHCVGCHNNTTQNGGLNLSTYTDVQTVALNGKLSGTINFQTGYPQMPPGGQKLSDCNITQIMKWIKAGAPNN